MHRVTRYHDISCGHRVVGHESKCAYLHGHNYRFHLTCEPVFSLDGVGRVVDFSVIKSHLCQWLEDNWDHKFLAWVDDPVMKAISTHTALAGFEFGEAKEAENTLDDSMVWVPFNPTAENIAEHFVTSVAPALLEGTGARLVECRIEETAKCSATYKV